ncbi:MAG: hypothetical protein ACE5LB_17690 [Acidiferrobacterales bacterium]
MAAPAPADSVTRNCRLSWKKLDASADGQITFLEYRDVWEQRMEKRFQRLDSNGDGILSENEIAKIRHRLGRVRQRFIARSSNGAGD